MDGTINHVGITIVLFFAFFGAVALIAIPIRLWQILVGKLLSILASLNRFQQFVVILGIVSLVATVLVWCFALYVIAMVIMDDPSRRIWGGSELGMMLNALGFVYFLFELMFVPVTWRQFKRSAPILIAACAIAIVMLPVLIYRAGLHEERRFDVYDIAKNLSEGMTVAEVQVVLDKKHKPFIKVASGTDEQTPHIRVTTSLGWAEALFLHLYFYEGRLVATRMVGEDSPNDKFRDQPPDMLPSDPDLLRLFRGIRL